MFIIFKKYIILDESQLKLNAQICDAIDEIVNVRIKTKSA